MNTKFNALESFENLFSIAIKLSTGEKTEKIGKKSEKLRFCFKLFICVFKFLFHKYTKQNICKTNKAK